MTVRQYAYGTFAYGQGRYAGTVPAVIKPSRSIVGIPFMVANDRYQVVACPDGGTASSKPKFRYWYAGPPLWDMDLAADTHYPKFHSLDELSVATVGELQLPPRTFEYVLRARQFIGEAIVQAIMVDYEPRPTALTESLSNQQQIGFSGKVLGYGVTDYDRDVGGGVMSGIAISDTFDFTDVVGQQASDTWPNIRSAFMPIRMNQRVRSMRVVFTNIRLVKLLRVTLLGDLGNIREQ